MTLIPRSSRPEVRNPLLSLPEAHALAAALDGPGRAQLEALLLAIARGAADRARVAWRAHKAPMACYWKVVSVYARHLARALRHLGRPAPAAN